jgi:hypothetical protein
VSLYQVALLDCFPPAISNGIFYEQVNSNVFTDSWNYQYRVLELRTWSGEHCHPSEQ